ncbi:hypothetical protein AY511_08760 [Corynebacterium diphtheriae bv. mitis]|nr:hypothetical protein AY511_08760 [Corynebacterium diphtheriae bv. mitis]
MKCQEKSFEIPPFSGSVEPEQDPQDQQHPKSCGIASGGGIFIGLGGGDLIVCNGNGWLGVGVMYLPY